jgi:hypothetical protein
MLERNEEQLGLKPERLAADAAHGTGKFLACIIGRDIRPHTPSGT